MSQLLSIFACVATSWFICFVQCQDISVEASHICSKADNNRLKFHINLHLRNGVATGLNALNETEGKMTTCEFTGAGTAESPYKVDSYVNLITNEETNGCGLMTTLINGETFYKWKLRVDRGRNSRGFIIRANCSRDTITNGKVTTLVKFNISSLSVVPRYAENITGTNTYATNSELTLRATVYPNGLQTSTALKDAKGIYLINCYSGTDNALTENRQLFINSNGCPVGGARLRPSNSPQTVGNNGDSPFVVEASFFRAMTIMNQSTIYVQCGIGKCTVDPDPACNNSCAVSQNPDIISPSGFDSGEQFKTSFAVQDNPTQQLFAAYNVAGLPIAYANVSTPFLLVSKFSPTGLDTFESRFSNDIRGAKGFYLYSCAYADNVDFVNSVVPFVDVEGCPIQGTLLSPSSGFELISVQNNLFTIQSGPVNPQQVASYVRLFARCNLGICTRPNHGHCQTRCGASTDNTGATLDVGYTGLMFKLSILNPVNQPAVIIDVTDVDGRVINEGNEVEVNSPLGFGVTVIPGGAGGGNAFGNAKGIYVANCYTSTVPNPTEDQKNYFIDRNGCGVQNSPYRTSQNCLMDTIFSGTPPLILRCGTFTPPEAGNLYQNCTTIGICLTESNRYCLDRCAQGPEIYDANVVPLGMSFSRVIRVKETDVGRTAIRSNEILTAVISVTVVVPIVVLCATAVVVYCIVNAQRPK